MIIVLNGFQLSYFTDTIHQFDGVIKDRVEKNKNKGMIKAFKGWIVGNAYKKELKKEAAFAFLAFAPQVLMSFRETTGVTGEEIIVYIESLLEGLDSAYRVTAGLWSTEREFLSYLSEVSGMNSRYSILIQLFFLYMNVILN